MSASVSSGWSPAPSSDSSHDSLVADPMPYDRGSSHGRGNSSGAREVGGGSEAPSLGDPLTPIHKSGRNGEEMTGSVLMRTRLRHRDSATPGSNSGNNGSAGAASIAGAASTTGAAGTAAGGAVTQVRRRQLATKAAVKAHPTRGTVQISDSDEDEDDDTAAIIAGDDSSDEREVAEPNIFGSIPRRTAAVPDDTPGKRSSRSESRQEKDMEQQQQQQQQQRAIQSSYNPPAAQTEETPTRPIPTARRASARAKSGMGTVPSRKEALAASVEAPSRYSPRRSRPSGPLLSSPRSRRRSRGSRDHKPGQPESAFENSQNLGSRATLDGSNLPFTPPLPHTHFPTFKGCARYDGFWKQQEPQQFFDCKFYPYTEPGVDPVFAVVGGSKVIVARPAEQQRELFDILLWMDEESASPSSGSKRVQIEGTRLKRGGRGGGSRTVPIVTVTKGNDTIELNSCAWLRHPGTKAPLLAVSGKPSAIKIIDVTNRKLDRILIGHGKEVNDLAASPVDSSILASASGDHTVRLWNIDPKYKKQPCVAMCAGEGHRQGLLTVAFHSKGNYLLTGGVDCAVCLWALPQLPDERSGSDKPTMIHYPHFKSTAVHMSFVDCVAFHHDLILSKSAMENKIVLWRIEGFDSRDPAPSRPPTGSDGATRSSFGGKYQRLIQFNVADTYAFYIRFSLFNFPDQRPILAIGNEKSKVLFWDLDALAEFAQTQSSADPQAVANLATQHATTSASTGSSVYTGRGGRWRKRGRGGRGRGGAGGGSIAVMSGVHQGDHSRQQSVMSEASSSNNVARSETSGSHGLALAIDALGLTGNTKQKLMDKYQMNDPFVTLDPHKLSTVQKVLFACRQVAWSVGGEYMVVAGDQGMLALFGRDMTWPDEMETL